MEQPQSVARERGTGRRWRRGPRATVLSAHGEPWLWLAGGALALAVAMIAGLLAFLVWQGAATFWPRDLVRIERTNAPALLGELYTDEIAPADAHETPQRRRMFRTGNFDLTGQHFTWVSDAEVAHETRPEHALVVERVSWGRFYGEPVALLVDGRAVADDPATVLARFEDEHARTLRRLCEKHDIETSEIGAVNHALEEERLALRKLELEHGADSAVLRTARESAVEREAELALRYDAIAKRIAAIDADNARSVLRLRTADGATKDLALAEVVRAYAPNELGWSGRLGVYLSRWWEFLSDVPRDANSEGGVFPAIFGTVVMTLLMSIAVVPFGVLAALYLREYAKAGVIVSLVRICVNNLAGVPSIVFGVFGLGFFCAIVGTSIDGLLFAERLPNPTYGKGGLLWAALTLALLTLPVVIVATEEAIAAVPNSMREGSYACGATRVQTIVRIVLPRALPGIMTGMILAIARGAGEVAPLMLVGAVKLAPQLAVDGTAPYVHPERSFLHLGFHIFDLGFQAQNSEAAKPMVFTTTLLLIAIVVALNLGAIALRTRLRRRHAANPF